jgi:hypothetical protein
LRAATTAVIASTMSSLPGGRDHLDRLARAIDDDNNVDAVTPITLSAYNFGAPASATVRHCGRALAIASWPG